MIWIVRCLVVLATAFAGLTVTRVRYRLAHDDADPAVVAITQRALASIPLVLEEGRYRGRAVPLNPLIAKQGGADTFTSLLYEGTGGEFHLYVGGSIRNQENFHAPDYCMPSAGWEILEESSIPFPAELGAARGARMRRLVLQHGPKKMVVYFWFQAGEARSDSEWKIRGLRLLDLWADRSLRPTLIVTVYAAVIDSVAETERSLVTFLRAVSPSLRGAIEGGS